MRRKLVMVLLGLGALGGFASGFARLCHHGHGHFEPGARFGHPSDFERRVADTCAESAWRVYQDRAAPGRAP